MTTTQKPRSFNIAVAPGAWGIEDASNPFNPSWEKVLDEAEQAGYKGIELGPYGYLPQDVDLLSRETASRNLQIIAGTIYDNLVSEVDFLSVVKKTHKTCQLLSGLPKAEGLVGQSFNPPYLVIIDEVNKERSSVAGLFNEAKRLGPIEKAQLIKHIKEIAEISKSYGIRAVLHPHAGGYIEFEDEIEEIALAIPEEIGLCLDTGHLYYSGMDPIKMLLKYSDRLDYIHFKDIDLPIYKNVIERRIGFFEGCSEGVMCPIGKGVVDYSGVKKLLESINYTGWITIEQERDPRDCNNSLKDVSESLQYLKKKGY
jgi:inosose dehydratase